ncbi:MAG: response regulator transcription factor [[Eubacterium] sulci]|nr:response regulator transcription factor [[Eubacterium] sulci]
MKILVVEDDKMIREGICEYMSEFGYEMVQAEDGKMALERFDKNDIGLVVLDIQIPFMSGLEVLREIRTRSMVPVLMLTAFGDEEYVIDAFSNLADGYMEKPFSLPVLKARLESMIKRYSSQSDNFKYGNAEVDFIGYTAKLNGEPVDIKAKELEILKFLLNNEGQALTRMQIIDNVWKESEEIPFDRVIDVYVKELRKKLELDCIVTIRNVGYKLERK